MTEPDEHLRELLGLIVMGDGSRVMDRLASSPDLATRPFRSGATRQAATQYFFEAIGRYIYAGDTALHFAAAAYRTEIARLLLERGADVQARNRHGATPLHDAAVGSPGGKMWNPDAQTATIAFLIAAGADPNSLDKRGVTPLHKAVRTRCAAAVRTLLEHGANRAVRNRSGSTPESLARVNSGRGGSGSAEAKLEQQEILRVFAQHSGPASY